MKKKKKKTKDFLQYQMRAMNKFLSNTSKKFLKVEVNQIIPSINNVIRKIEWIGYTVY